jgi:hypothetical protein
MPKSEAWLESQRAQPRGRSRQSASHPLDDRLRRALVELGVIGESALVEIADHDHERVWAWIRYVRHQRHRLSNPAGFLREKVRSGERPPGTEAEAGCQAERGGLAMENCMLVGDRMNLHRQDLAVRYDIDADTMALWQRAQGELALQMARETYEAWLQGSLLLSVVQGPDTEAAAQATIGVRDEAARAWLQHRLSPVIRQTLSRLLDKPVVLSFELLLIPS